MAEIGTVGWAITIADGTTLDGRKLVAVFSDEWEAKNFMYGRYPLTVKPEMSHVFYGVEPF